MQALFREQNKRGFTYAKFQHVSTRGRKKKSHIKFLLLLLNLTPIIKQKEELRRRIWRYIRTPRHQVKTWTLLNALTHSNSASDGNQRRRQFRLRFLFKRRTIVRSTV